LGSIVQKGKFAACAAAVRVSALNSVDLPTFGRPTIPTLKPMSASPLRNSPRHKAGAIRVRKPAGKSRLFRGPLISRAHWPKPAPDENSDGTDMTRIDDTFARLKAEGKKAFVAYVMAGDPDHETSLEIVKGLPGAGVDIIELGMPFTDPMADGPTIQLAGQRALDGGRRWRRRSTWRRALKARTTPRRS
jgi:hypothetical protein